MKAIVTSRLPIIAAELRPAVNAALRAGAEEVAESAKQKVPKRTHALERGIHVESDGDGYMVIAGNRAAFYGHLVEYGHRKGDGPGAASPRPFLIPALEENRQNVIGLTNMALRTL